MGDTALEIIGLSKWYRLGAISTGSLRQDVKRWWVKDVLRKADPFFETVPGTAPVNHIWALKDVNFQIREGEVWGFLGSNGAGKSTLLKIISRIVKPTHGQIRGKGTIASLLEVGTGFHEELSGRENIYISGYLMGMKKEDIRKNFDAIVAFSGLSDFIDTPVKRYSSGMYVKLAFGIAAHLEPDILIVDEVLAVGDAEFQKKCIGKMNEVSREKGRTILFVSHNMQAIKQLCTKALWLQGGKEAGIGNAHEVINQYITSVRKNKLGHQWTHDTAPGNEWVKIKEVSLQPKSSDDYESIDVRTALLFRASFWNEVEGQELRLSPRLFAYGGDCIFELPTPSKSLKKGLVEAECLIPGNFLNDGSYYLSVLVVKEGFVPVFQLDECISFDVADYREAGTGYTKWIVAVRPAFSFSLKESSE